MADFNGPEQTPNVGVRGNPESLPVLKRQEQTNAAGQIPNFHSAFNELAVTPTSLGELSTQFMTSASNALMDKWGYEVGQNPHGNLFPSITKADQRFAEVYSRQAQATLGLQANKMMLEGQMELDKAYKLTPGMIDSYTTNMAKGLDQIVAQAPDNIKGSLQADVGGSLARSTYQLNNKMTSQQKTEYKDQMALYSQTQTKSIYEAGMSGDEKGAKSIRDRQIERNNQLHESGVISAGEAAANNETAKQTYLTAIYSQRAIEARKNGKLEPYLRDLANNKPKDATFLQWQAVGKNVLGNVSQIDALERRDQTLTTAQFDLAIAEQRVTSESIEELKSQVSPEQFTRSMISYSNALNKRNSTQQTVSNLATNWGSPVAQADAGAKAQNETFQALTTAYQQKQSAMGKGEVSEIEAKTVVAQSAGASIPQFTSELNNMLISGNPNLMIQASNAYRVLGGIKAPISSQARAMVFGFDSQIQQGRTPEEAAQIARDNIAPKSNDELQAQENQWTDYRKKHLATFTDQTHFAKGLMNIPWHSEVPNMPALTIQVNKAFESNLKLLNGDVEAAKAMTRSNLEQSYGTTYVNGHKEYTYLPIEKFMGVDNGAAGVIQNNVAMQASRQLEATRKAYEAGHTDFYYDLPDRPSFEKAVEAKKELNELLDKTSYFERSNNNEFFDRVAELKKTIGSYADNKPIKIRKVWRGEEESISNTLPTKGLITAGNINLENRKKLLNSNGTTSSVSTITIGIENGKTALIPTVIDGKRLSNDDAINHFKNTHEHMGIFETRQDADRYDEVLHKIKGWTGKKNIWPKRYQEGHVEEFELSIQASSNLGLGINSTTPIVGAYDISLRTSDGRLMPLIGVDNIFNGNMVYRPNLDELRTQYFALNGINNPVQANEEYKQYFLESQKQKEALPKIWSYGYS